MLLVSVTPFTCKVLPFIDTYSELEEIPVVTAATAYENPVTSAITILVFHQCLWFGPALKHSLICPQQVRSNGIQLCDDPYDPYRSLGIYDPDTECHIPMDVRDSMVGLTTRCPTIEEYHMHPHLIMTADSPWNPASPDLPHNSQGLALSHPHSQEFGLLSLRSTMPSMLSALSTCSTIYNSRPPLRTLQGVRSTQCLGDTVPTWQGG